jgi:Alpha-galactosyl-binding fungal lectin
MIKKCVMLPYEGEATCNAVIDKAQENINTILKPNLKQILQALNAKMAADGVVVYNGYARYFNEESEGCGNNQQWAMSRLLPKYWFRTALKLTIERRKRFNGLVIAINQAIRDVVKDVANEVNYKVGFADWDPWAIEGVKGQMCDPLSGGIYPDPKQPDLQFFKPDTHVTTFQRDELKRREAEAKAMFPNGEPAEGTDSIDKSIYDSLLWKSSDPRAEVRHKLDRRAVSPPNCPGDSDWFDPTLGLGLPDSFGKLFHPNELGHQTVASFAVAKAIDLRAKVLGLGSQSCQLTDEFKCWQKEGRRGYATADKLNENYKDFCDDVRQPANTVGWRWEKTYFKDTPDEHSFVLQLSDRTADFNKGECVESFERIINGCDGGDPENPLNWKFGGKWRKGEYSYELNIKRDNRPWPMIKATHGSCNGNWAPLLSHYNIRGTSLFAGIRSCQHFLIARSQVPSPLTASSGAGFSSWDFGQKTIIPSMKGCLGLGITGWKFEYFDAPDKDGMEWKASFNTPVFVKARCFSNNKVVRGAGGFTNGCSGSDP